MAGGTSQFIHVGQHLIAGEVARRFVVAAINIGNDPFKRNVNISNPTKFILIMEMEFLALRTIENQVSVFWGQVFKGLVHINPKLDHGLLQHLRIVVRRNRIPRRKRSFTESLARIWNNQIQVHL